MKMNFGFAEGDVRIALSEVLNPNFTEEKGWLIETVVLSADEGSCLSYNFEKQVYETHTYEMKEDGVPALAESATELEFYTFDTPEARDALAAELETAKADFIARQAEWEVEKESFNTANVEAEARIVELEESLTAYQQKDKEIESAKKDELIAEYATLLPEDTIQAISADAANFSYEEIESKLSVEYTRSLRKDSKKVPSGNFDKHSNPERALMDLLSKYSK
jgi:hypothetical protein